jgi:hypothetical protein
MALLTFTDFTSQYISAEYMIVNFTGLFMTGKTGAHSSSSLGYVYLIQVLSLTENSTQKFCSIS